MAHDHQHKQHHAAHDHASDTGGDHEAAASPGLEFSAAGAAPQVGGEFHQGPSASDQGYGEADTTDEPNAHQAAMVARDINATVNGKHTNLKTGTYVEVLREDGTFARSRVFSGHHGHTALLPLDALDQQPALSEKDKHKSDLDAGGYMEYRGVLWNKHPAAGDVDQGRLNNCSLMASAAALARNDPHAIMQLFGSHEPNQTSYQVTLHQRHGNHFKPKRITVDTMFPSKGDLDSKEGSPIYAGKNHKHNHLDTQDHQIPLWPLLLEKAFASIDKSDDGGYETLDSGGIAAQMMEMLTGRHAEVSAIEADPHDLLGQLKSLDRHDKIVVLNTKSDPASAKVRNELGFHKWHFYDFAGFHGDRLKFHNPWGHDHPDPIHAADVPKIFSTVQAVSRHGKKPDLDGIGQDLAWEQEANQDLEQGRGGGVIRGGDDGANGGGVIRGGDGQLEGGGVIRGGDGG